MAIDPVCGKELALEETEAAMLYSDCRLLLFSPYSDQQEQRFYFCSAECKLKFDTTPGFFRALTAGPPPSEPCQPPPPPPPPPPP